MMKSEGVKNSGPGARPKQIDRKALLGVSLPQKSILGLLLVVALVSFEMFNFDTTRYALSNLLGDVRFAGVGWATILAIAFCAIDFAGLARLFTPERGQNEPTAVWYLMGAWLLGATMNAIMTWWAISLTLLSHDFGNEVLSREQLLRWVPFFVAVLVWLTRILFIGAISVAGEHIFAGPSMPRTRRPDARPSNTPKTAVRRTPPAGRPFRPNPAPMRAAPWQENGRQPPTNRPNSGGASRSRMQAPGRSTGRPRR